MQILPFSYISSLIIEAMLDDSIQNLNIFPKKTGVSKNLSPLTIVAGTPRFFFTKLKLSFGEQAEVHDDNDYQTKSANTRGIPAITLNLVNNSSGSYYFYSLATGR